MVDVGDAVDDPHDLPLERRRLSLAGVREDAVDDLERQVEPPGDLGRLLVVTETAGDKCVERSFARVPERGVAHVVPEADRLGQVLVQAQGARDHPGDSGRLERMGHPGPVVITGGIDEDLRLPFQPPERLRMEDAVAVALERRTDEALLLCALTTTRRVRAHRER